FVCFKVQESRALARYLFLMAFLVGPLSLTGVLTLRHGLRVWTEHSTQASSLTFVCLAALIRPTFILFRPPLSRATAALWILREWRKLWFGAIIGTAILVSGCFLLNERGIGRLDMVYDCGLYLASMTALALGKNGHYAARYGYAWNDSDGVPEEPEPEKL